MLQELLENVADPKEFGKRGEPLFFGQLLLLALIFFPPAFFKVCPPLTLEMHRFVLLTCSWELSTSLDLHSTIISCMAL